MDFRVRLDANHSDSLAIARICNDAWREKTRFCVRSIAKQTTSVSLGWKWRGEALISAKSMNFVHQRHAVPSKIERLLPEVIETPFLQLGDNARPV
jgi:hypothetical protein